jgi:hypothetical protein
VPREPTWIPPLWAHSRQSRNPSWRRPALPERDGKPVSAPCWFWRAARGQDLGVDRSRPPMQGVAQSRNTTACRRAAGATFGSSVLLMTLSTVCYGCSSRLHPATHRRLGELAFHFGTSTRQALVARDAAADRATAPSARDGPGAPGYLPPGAAVWDSWGRARSCGTLLLRGNCCWRRRVGGGRSHSRVHHLRSIQAPARVDRRSRPRQCREDLPPRPGS